MCFGKQKRKLGRACRPSRWRAGRRPIPRARPSENAIFGGGTSVSRTYHRADRSLDIAFIADSPMMQGIGSLVSSGIVTGSDIKLLIIDGRKVTYTRSDNSYTRMIGKVLVSVKGPGVDDASLRAYLEAIKFADLEKASAN
jgi:hypothetical protein